VFLLAFSLISKASYENVSKKVIFSLATNFFEKYFSLKIIIQQPARV
jgi:hypothetical protein